VPGAGDPFADSAGVAACFFGQRPRRLGKGDSKFLDTAELIDSWMPFETGSFDAFSEDESLGSRIRGGSGVAVACLLDIEISRDSMGS
jgi:hypothetical protein